jgi:hypothetical protein
MVDAWTPTICAKLRGGDDLDAFDREQIAKALARVAELETERTRLIEALEECVIMGTCFYDRLDGKIHESEESIDAKKLLAEIGIEGFGATQEKSATDGED